MKSLRTLTLAAVAGLLLLGCGERGGDRDVLFQTSTIQALLEGAYDGELTCAGLRKHGDFGLGTFDALDGEMVVLDGVVYQVKADGKAYRASGSMTTPFAAVTFFDPDRTMPLRKQVNFQELTRTIDGMLPSKNVPYAVSVEGVFQHVKTRSVPGQTKPYPRLAEVVKNQPTFEFEVVRGTVVGFRLPDYVKGINVPGYHLHFLTADRTAGGHVLDLVAADVKIKVDSCSSIHLALPVTAGFRKADLTRQNEKELERVEK